MNNSLPAFPRTWLKEMIGTIVRQPLISILTRGSRRIPRPMVSNAPQEQKIIKDVFPLLTSLVRSSTKVSHIPAYSQTEMGLEKLLLTTTHVCNQSIYGKWIWRNTAQIAKQKHTFLMSLLACKPQPRASVRKISTSGYCLLVKHWFWQRPPAGQPAGWHSYSNMRLIHSESRPQGFSSVGLQLQRGISNTSAVKICTLPTGRFTFKHTQTPPSN